MPTSRSTASDDAEPLPIGPSEQPDLLDVLPRATAIDVSDYFLIAGDDSSREVAHIGRQLDTVYRANLRLAKHLGITLRRPQRKLRVVWCTKYADFIGFLNYCRVDPDSAILGHFDTDLDVTVLCALQSHPDWKQALSQASADEQLRRRIEKRGALIARNLVQHEAAHHTQHALGMVSADGSTPTWLKEGLALLFEVPLKDDRLPQEQLSNMRLHEFELLYGAGPTSLPDLTRLVTDESAWCGSACYPLAYALTKYLVERNPAGVAALLHDSGPAAASQPTSEKLQRFARFFGTPDEQWSTHFWQVTMKLAERARAKLADSPAPANQP